MSAAAASARGGGVAPTPAPAAAAANGAVSLPTAHLANSALNLLALRDYYRSELVALLNLPPKIALPSTDGLSEKEHASVINLYNKALMDITSGKKGLV